MKCFLLMVLMMVSAGPVFAQLTDVLDIERVGSSSSRQSVVARKEIIESVVEQVAREQIVEMIGREKYSKNRQLIQNKILKEAGRFVPVIRNGRLQRGRESSRMKVQLKISLKNLKSILLEHGLLYQREGLPILYPFFHLTDRVHGLQFKWWSSERSNDFAFLSSMVVSAEQLIRQEMRSRGFFSVLPTDQDHRQLLPLALRGEVLNQSSLDLFRSFLYYDIYVDGEVVIDRSLSQTDKYRVEVHWMAKYQGTHRVIAEVSREFTTEAGPFDLVVRKGLREKLPEAAESLGVQLMEAWQKGTFGASLFTVVLQGKLDYPQLNEFKRQLLAHAKYIKNVRERKFESEQVVLEADVTGGLNELHQIFQKAKVEGLSFQLVEMGTSRVVMQLNSTEAS